MLGALWSVWLELAPWLLLGAAVSGLLHVALPEGFVARHLSGRGGVFRAVLLGVPLPLCSCGVIPAGVGLKRQGASDGSSIAFLVSTPQTGVDSVLVSAAFLGWPFALFKVAAAGVTGVLAGGLVDAFGGTPLPVVSSAPTGSATTEAAPAWRRFLDHADDVVGSIWGWVVFGVVVSAALQTWLPPGALAGAKVAGGLVAGLLVLALSVPLYVCATASVPIAAGLLHAGLPPSAALVFLMAGPATNLATLGAVHGTFGRRVTAIYLSTVALGALGLGFVFDRVLPTTVMAHAAHDMHGPVATVAAVVLLLLFARYAARDLSSWMAPTVSAEAPSVSLDVDGMTCQGCARKVGEAVRSVDGVSAVEVELEPGRVTVQGAAGLDALRQAIVGAGFSVR